MRRHGRASRGLGIDLAVVGPEAPLVAGLGDRLRAAGITSFAPSGDAAMIEGSKEFAKQVMIAAGVPTAQHEACDTIAAAQAAISAIEGQVVVKADGLAAGKGVFVCSSALRRRPLSARASPTAASGAPAAGW